MRLINADALKEDCRMANDCKDCKTNVRDCEYDYVYTKMDFCGWLDDAPTVDAVPVVRCKDCKYWKTGEGVNRSKKVKFCTYNIGHYYARRDEDFCSRGERKDDEHETD